MALVLHLHWEIAALVELTELKRDGSQNGGAGPSEHGWAKRCAACRGEQALARIGDAGLAGALAPACWGGCP